MTILKILEYVYTIIKNLEQTQLHVIKWYLQRKRIEIKLNSADHWREAIQADKDYKTYSTYLDQVNKRIEILYAIENNTYSSTDESC